MFREKLRMELEKGQQGKMLLSNRLNEEMNAVFYEKCLRMKAKKTKFLIFSNFHRFYSLFVQFSINFVDKKVKTVKQGTNS